MSRELREELKRFAVEYDIPIVEEETLKMLSLLLSMQKPARILEIGTAIGYSAIAFADAAPEAAIVSIEREEAMYYRAKENVERAGLAGRITLLLGDANEILPTLTEPFDFIFMDAAKAQYQKFFEHCKPLLKNEGLLCSDDVHYLGMLYDKEKYHRRMVTIVKRMRAYLDELQNTPGYQTVVLSIGDGLAITRKEIS